MSERPVPSYQFDRKRWSSNDQVIGLATVVLFVALFLPWFGVRIGARNFSLDVTVSGLSAHGYLYIVLVLCIGIVAYLIVRAGIADVEARVPIGHEVLIRAVSAINALLVLIAFFDKPGGSAVGWRYGSVIGLVAAAVAVLPIVMPAIQARRSGSGRT